MRLPFSVEQFFQVFADYNAAIWPAQIVAYVLALTVLGLALQRNARSGRVAAGVLAVFWIWMGVVYHILYFSPINPAAFVFGFFFIAQGFLFGFAGGFKQQLRFGFNDFPAVAAGALLILYAMLGYPLLSAALGHGYPATPAFGVAPCPTTIFTFGLMLWLTSSMPRYLLIIPFLWAVIGTTAAFTLDVPADYGLGIAAVIATSMISFRRRAGRSGVPSPA